MKPEYWHKRWDENNTPFHVSNPNPFFMKYFHKLSLTPGAHIFLPLCGKTLDINLNKKSKNIIKITIKFILLKQSQSLAG